MREMEFQEHGATAHTARASMDIAQRMFRGHVISLFGDVFCQQSLLTYRFAIS